MGMPPIEIRDVHVLEGNTSQGCCATIEVSDDARVVFSTRSNDIKPKNRSVSLFNNIQCCVFGETREERENRRTRQAYERALREREGLDLNEVLQILEIDAEETAPMTLGDHKKIREYLDQRAEKKGEPEEKMEDLEATSRIMSAASFPTVVNPRAGPSAPLPIDIVLQKQTTPEIFGENPPLIAANGMPKRHKVRTPHLGHPNSSSLILPIADWDSIEVGRYFSQAHLNQEVNQEFFQEVAEHFSDEHIGPVEVQKILSYFQELVQKKEKERELYEQKMEKVKQLVDVVLKKMAQDKKNPQAKMKFTPRTTTELVLYVMDASEELKAMYQEVLTSSNSAPKEMELDLEHDGSGKISDYLMNHFGYSEEGAKIYTARVHTAQLAHKTMSGQLSACPSSVSPERVRELLKECVIAKNPSSEGEEEVREMVIADDM